MRILHIISYFQPQVGYQEYYLAKEQLKQGHEVTFITSDRYYPFNNFQESYSHILGKRKVGSGISYYEGIKILRLNTLLEFNSSILLKKLKKSISEVNPELIIVHGLEQLISIQLILFSHDLRKFKLIFDSHWGGYYKNNNWKRNLFGFFWRKFIRKKYTILKAKTIAITDECADSISNYFKLELSDISIVKLGVDQEVFSFSNSERNKIRISNKIPEDAIVGIYSGKISQDKGIEILLDAVNSLLYDYPMLYFIFIGFPSDRALTEKILNYKSKRVLYIRAVTPKELSWYYSASDFAIWPKSITASHYEAMAVGLPIIVSKLKASSERVKYNNGIQLVHNSKEEVVDSIKRLVDNDRLRKKMGQNGKVAVDKFYSWKKLNKDFLNEV